MNRWLLTLVTGGLLMAAPVRAQHAGHEHSGAPAATTPELQRELEQVRQATERYRDHDAAVADGFKLFGAEGPLMGEHWYQPDRVREQLDLTQPSTLQYAWIDGKRELVGVAYTLYRRPTDPMPEGFAGDGDHWHVHDVTKLAQALTADRPVARWIVDRRIRRGRVGAGDGRTHLTMVHAWPWLDNPDGPFAQMHRALPYLRAGLPASFAQTGDEDAAWGVSLLGAGACEAEIRRLDALAHLSGDQRARLAGACARAAEEVRSANVPEVAAVDLNRVAASAWRAYREVQDATLTGEQRARLAAAVEHEMMGPG
jgi:hypothetical protein